MSWNSYFDETPPEIGRHTSEESGFINQKGLLRRHQEGCYTSREGVELTQLRWESSCFPLYGLLVRCGLPEAVWGTSSSPEKGLNSHNYGGNLLVSHFMVFLSVVRRCIVTISNKTQEMMANIAEETVEEHIAMSKAGNVSLKNKNSTNAKRNKLNSQEIEEIGQLANDELENADNFVSIEKLCFWPELGTLLLLTRTTPLLKNVTYPRTFTNCCSTNYRELLTNKHVLTKQWHENWAKWSPEMKEDEKKKFDCAQLVTRNFFSTLTSNSIEHKIDEDTFVHRICLQISAATAFHI
ncbi:19964_t:CDS:2, partial [Cetraspora pellucida]